MSRSPFANVRLQRLQRLLTSGLAERSLRDPEVQAFVEHLTSQQNVVIGNGSAPVLGLSLHMGKYRDREKVSFNIPGVFLIKDNGSTLSVNQRPTGLDPAFAKFITAIMETAAREAQQFPEIQKIEIRAESVMNQSLVQMFKAMGFEGQMSTMQIDPMTSYALLGSLGGMPMGTQWINPMQAPGDHTTGMSAWGPGHPEHGRTWVLRLNLANLN